MKRTRRFRLLAAGVAVAVSSGVVVTTTMQPAAAANDYQIIVDNLDDALGVLFAGFADAAETYLSTQSVEAAGAVVVDTITDAGAALVTGTAEFGQLAFGMIFVNLALQGATGDLLAILDDPALAADYLTADDLKTWADNLLPFIHDLTVGELPINSRPGLADAIAQLLVGRIMGPGGTATTYFVGDLTNAILGAFATLDGGFSGPLSGPVLFPFTVAGLVGGGALDGFAGAYVQSLEDALGAQLNGPLAVVTGPVFVLLKGLDYPRDGLPLGLGLL